jgi:hypothetical protein
VVLQIIQLSYVRSSPDNEKRGRRKIKEMQGLTWPVANLGNKSGISALHPFAQLLFPSINPLSSGNFAHIGERVEEDASAFPFPLELASPCKCLSTSDIGVAVNIFLLPPGTVLSDDGWNDLKAEGLISLVMDDMVVEG